MTRRIPLVDMIPDPTPATVASAVPSSACPPHTAARIRMVLRGLRQRQIAKALGVSDTAISQAFAGRSDSILKRISDYLDSLN